MTLAIKDLFARRWPQPETAAPASDGPSAPVCRWCGSERVIEPEARVCRACVYQRAGWAAQPWRLPYDLVCRLEVAHADVVRLVTVIGTSRWVWTGWQA